MRSIVMCGIPRSGTTLIWQILKSIFPKEEVIKTHPDTWEFDEKASLILSIRDPRDITASLLRVRLSRNSLKVPTMSDVDAVLRRTVSCFSQTKRLMNGPHTLLRYEEFYQDHSFIYNEIEKMFDIHIPCNIREQLSDEFSLEKNKNRADKQKNFLEVDDWEIHGDHIGHIDPGYWKEYMPEWCIDFVETFCRSVVKEWNYENS